MLTKLVFMLLALEQNGRQELILNEFAGPMRSVRHDLGSEEFCLVEAEIK